MAHPCAELLKYWQPLLLMHYICSGQNAGRVYGKEVRPLLRGTIVVRAKSNETAAPEGACGSILDTVRFRHVEVFSQSKTA